MESRSPKDVFAEVIELPPEEREGALSRLCEGNESVLREVRELIGIHEGMSGFLGEPTVTVDLARGGADAVGSMIGGRYKLLELLGEGGFGQVFMAEQRTPVRRMVAVKIIKLGMDTKQVVARFEQERQALAMMDHPNIARVLDAGATRTGRPYFVMELVRGEPITRFCDERRLPMRERLELLVQVCHAVQHAHQKGIIHRDIKPSNILVTLHDGKPVPKVIDFGIAKATNARLTEKTLFTELRQFVGTPAYMSPEQAELSGLDVDTRSDVYSLGVLMYELLTGTTPFSTDELLKKGYEEIQRVIREIDPPRPSTRASSLGSTLPSVAAQRGVEPARLPASLRGDVDWIVMKCLEKSRHRRYHSVDALGGDIAAFLEGREVSAVPPSTAYRFRKFFARHRGLVLAGSSVAAALLLGLAGTTWGLIETRRAERRAASERDRATIVGDFLSQTFKGVSPQVAKGRDTALLGALMDDAARRLERGQMGENKDAEHELRIVIADVYDKIGRFEDASRVLKPVGDAGVTPAHRLRATLLRAEIAIQTSNPAGAEPLLREALAEIEAGQPPNARARVDVYSKLGKVARDQSRDDEAVEWHTKALDAARTLRPPDDEMLASSLGNLASSMRQRGRFDEANTLYEETMRVLRTPALADSTLLVDALNGRATLLVEMQRLDEAEHAMREALAAARRVYPDPHPILATTLHNLGGVLFQKQAHEECVQLLTEALGMVRRLHPPDSPEVLGTMAALGATYAQMGRLEEGARLTRETIEILERSAPPGPARAARERGNLAIQLLGLGRRNEALVEAERGLRDVRAQTQPDNPDVLRMMGVRARCLGELGRAKDAAEQYREILRLGAGSKNAAWLADTQAMLSAVLLDQQPPESAVDAAKEAESLLRACLDARLAMGPKAGLGVAYSRAALGRAIVLQFSETQPATTERLREAESLLTEGFAYLDGHQREIPANVRGVRLGGAAEGLARLYEAWDHLEPGSDKAAQAQAWRERSARIRTETATPAD